MMLLSSIFCISFSSTRALFSDILDIPEFFWERTDLKVYYREARTYLDIKQRCDVLNTRLQVRSTAYHYGRTYVFPLTRLRLYKNFAICFEESNSIFPPISWYTSQPPKRIAVVFNACRSL
jgi:hypothetical protein